MLGIIVRLNALLMTTADAVGDRLRRDEGGAISAEFVAVVVIVAAVIAALWQTDIPGRVSACGEAALNTLFTREASIDNFSC